jgi:hypothetical protein
MPPSYNALNAIGKVYNINSTYVDTNGDGKNCKLGTMVLLMMF